MRRRHDTARIPEKLGRCRLGTPWRSNGQFDSTDDESWGMRIKPLSRKSEEVGLQPPAPAPRRRRRWLRRTGIAILALFVALTIFSFAYNAVTDEPAAVPKGLTYVRTGDLNTRYREWGATGSPIVLVHGFIESADTWQATAQLLARDGHHVYALDLDGYGYTQRVAPFDRDHQAAQLLAFITALHLDHPILVGHSSGATIGAEAALRAPTEVGGVMFLDGDGLATGAGPAGPLVNFLTSLFINPYRTTVLRLAIHSDAVIRSAYSDTCGKSCPPLDAAGLDHWRRPLEVAGAEDSLWAMAKLGVPGLPASQLAELATLAMPKAVVFGAADSDFSKTSPYETAGLIGAPAPTLIPGAAHLTPVNSPGAVARAIEDLVAHSKAHRN